MVGDSYVLWFAMNLHDPMSDPRCLEVLCSKGATLEAAHDLISLYKSQARKVSRMYILHVGVIDILKGGCPEAIVDSLRRRWEACTDSLVIASVPEVSTHGKLQRATAMLLNARLSALCQELGTRFLDLTPDLSYEVCMTKGNAHHNAERANIVATRVAKIANRFLGSHRPNLQATRLNKRLPRDCQR